MSIVIDRGVYTSIPIIIDEDIDFKYIEKIVFTLKNNLDEKPIITYDIASTGEHILLITPEQSLRIKRNAICDFNIIFTDGKRYKITENYSVIIREGAGNVYD